MTITIPIKTFSEQNQSSHWRARARRVKTQRTGVALYLSSVGIRDRLQAFGYDIRVHSRPVIVTLTRISPRQLDSHDNLRYSLKPTADEVASQLGIKDNNPLVEWCYAQAKGEPKEYSVQIDIEGKPSHP